ncbi:MAG: hypothetical protein SF097_16240 [Acidobacteriota bacterium]|nr:hypothetical protein [Acidobacteriota bacterium]
MSIKGINNTELLQLLAKGWPPEQAGIATEFAARWQFCLRSSGKIEAPEQNALRFNLHLNGLRLHGAENVACLAIGGSGENANNIGVLVKNFWYKTNSTDRLVFVLACSDDAYEQAVAALPQVRCLRLRPEQILSVLQSCEPLSRLKYLLREQYSPHQLLPYNITMPVKENMFFGRENELDRLINEPSNSFAIVGAGRLGKTSLALEFHRRLLRENDSRATRKFHIDFFDCIEQTSDGVARFLAKEIDPSKRSSEMTVHDLAFFLRFQANKLGGPVEMFLDEVDRVCHLQAFDILTMSARRGICRFVMCGRAMLLRILMTENSPLNKRVEMIRLLPLDEGAAGKLILEPMEDLGFDIINQEKLLQQVFHWTGRLPHLLQFYGTRLVNLALASGAKVIVPELVDKVRSAFETVQLFAEQLEKLSDATTRIMAEHLLTDGRRHFTLPGVQEIGRQRGINLNNAQTLEICNDLVISNVLMWHEDAYYIANQSLVHYARKMRFLDNQPKNAHLPF